MCPMPKSHLPNLEESRRQLIDLVRSGCTPESLAQEFVAPPQSIRNWLAQAVRGKFWLP